MNTEKLEMWEIMVPTMSNEKKPFRTRYHKVWDKSVYEIAGGVTIMTPVKGKWVFKDDEKLFEERMIPVRIVCTRAQIEKIITMTIKYYDQLAVIAYKISDEVIIRNKNGS